MAHTYQVKWTNRNGPHGHCRGITWSHVSHRYSHCSPLSPITSAWLPPPVVARVLWPNVRKRQSSNDTPASIWSHSSSKPQEAWATTPRSSSNNSTATRTTHRQPSGTLGRPSKPHCTTASPNNNSEPSPRDRHDCCLTHVIPLLPARNATSAHTPLGWLSAHFSSQATIRRGSKMERL